MDTTGGTGPAGLGDALREHAAAGFVGVLRVDGQPGGCVHLAGGGISGCETPGAPSLEVIMLRSGRVTEDDWNTAFAAAAAAGHPLTAELTGRGLLGGGEAEALLRTALADAMFAVLSGTVDRWAEAQAGHCQLPLVPSARPGWLLAESARREQALAGFAGPVIGARDRATAVPGAALAGRRRGPGPGRGEILALANGRRTVRDLAFALGRGLYETMLDLSRMRDANLVAIALYGGESAPRDGSSGIASDGGGGGQTAAGLPRRGAVRSGPRPGEAGRRDLAAGVALLRPRATGGTKGGGTRDPSP